MSGQTNVLRRFLLKVVIDDATGCWNWTAAKCRGYAYFKAYGKQHRAARFAYKLFVGPISAALQVDHLCRNIGCVNPQHLEAVTPRVNTLRGDSIVARNAVATHCIRGHEFSKDNTRTSGGRRTCRACMREHMRWFLKRRKENAA